MEKQNQEQNQNQNQNENGNQEYFSKLDQRLELIEKSVQTGNQLSSSDEDFLSSILAGDNEQKGVEVQEALEKNRQNFEDQDFDKMSNREIVSAVMGRVGKEFDNRLTAMEQGINDRLNQSAVDAANSTLQVEIKELQEDKKIGEAFKAAYPQVLEIAEKNPNLSLRQAFILATSGKVRGDLDKMILDKRNADDKAAGMSLPDSITSTELTESLKGKKSHADVAHAIAKQIGL